MRHLFLGLVFIGAVSANAAQVDANIFVNLSKKIVPSVVNISTLTTIKGGMGGSGPMTPDDILRKFFGDLFRQNHGFGGPRGAPDRGMPDDEEEGGPGLPPHGNVNPKNLPKAMSLGTGFIIDSSGLILTNNHVVADADEIKISFTEAPDEKPTDGEVVGRDTELDVALIRVKAKREMTAATLGDSEQLEVGEYVIAVGNPFGQGHSVTHGIISAKGRLTPDFPLVNYIQTDAPINPGNSGGPLVNLKGEVIGINNAIDQRAQGIGFAIPISLVKKILPQLRTKGTVARGYIGVLVGEMSPEIASKLGVAKDLQAPFVTNVYPDAPAEKAGLKPYDVVLEFNGKPIHSSSELILAVTSIEVGQLVPVKILRAGTEQTVSIHVAQRPGSQELAAKNKGKKKGKKPPKTPDMGMELDDVTSEVARELGMVKPSGVLVRSTSYGGPGDKAGLMQGDVILEVDRKVIKGVDQFFAIVKTKKSYLLRVRRMDPQGQEVFSVVILDLKD
ncbi:trypsin-like peptidase domain-containing protein [Bdellovibrionota bacterium FG-1]